MSIEASMAGYYANRAREYERIYKKPERQEDLRRLREYFRSVFAGADVFELACGTGYWTAILADTANSILASDINDEVLAIARAKSMDPTKVRFVREDAYALSIPVTPANAGVAVFWWSHVPISRRAAFLEGFHRRICPGGRVVFVDNVYVAGSSTPIARTDCEGNTYQLRRLDDGSTHEVLKNFPSREELIRGVESAATDICVELLPYYWILSYRLRQESAVIGGTIDNPVVGALG